ncbi:ATP-binding protein [Parabacteroides sp. ASD2025]|jgi:signal transduction histidine kinase|uniref:ATP-binding protein n=1 Tax=Parabacteroides sp. ASD2025 TaxID=3415987 RepID=UPI003CEF6257
MAKFKTSARTLDLLGRQQIAGIPTAINELFKNAHDAYADYAEIDYFRSNRIFILRDNGLGMTKEDFETRWLTLGTDSKLVNSSMTPPPHDSNKPKREITGEKGIGRLAIASIGRQVLVLSRAKCGDRLSKTLVAFINWGVFELPGLNLDDIIIPLKEIEGGELPNQRLIQELKNELIFSIEKLIKDNRIDKEKGFSLKQEIEGFNAIPETIEKTLPNPFLSLLNNGYGTHFYISPVDEMLDNDIDGEPNSTDATKIEKMLVGFTNTMTPNHPKPLIDLAFRDYKSDDGTYKDIINKDYFFTPEDFLTADHHIEGKFDEFGQFEGSITIYREKEFQNHIINWNGNHFRKATCGPFSIDFAYVQGAQRQSIINQEDYDRITAKCDKYGGIYIYKDNIRILPYGDSDYDFIDIEKNRTKSASFYFFSYRRMFGAINISKKENSELKEKAGREGFIENKAYRQMREILKNFFVQLAADFFRESGGPKSIFWQEKREEQLKVYKALDKREKQAKIKKELFQKRLNTFFQTLSAGTIKLNVQNILKEAEAEFSSIVYIKDIEKASQKLLDIETATRNNLDEYKKTIKISQPRGFSLSKRSMEDYNYYIIEFEKVNKDIFIHALQQLDNIIEQYSSRLHIEISKRKRLELAVDQVSADAKKIASKKGNEANDAANSVKQRVKELANQLMIGLEDKIRIIKDEFKQLQINNSEDFDLVIERKRMEDEILAEKEKATNILDIVLKQLDSIYWEEDKQGNIVTNDDITQALQEKVLDLEDKITSDVELSQLGLAIGIIHHEFSSTVHSIRNSIKDLKAWADVNEKMEGVYINIRTNFEHLDSYLNMFTPLNRRLQRIKEDIPANDIRIYIADLFYPRFERHCISLKQTKGFSKRSIYGFRSTFYPVFVNIIDNAIHWVKQIDVDEEKFIKLHADDTGFYISNNGPEIPITDYDRIFSYGFTRKPKGRGMGLHISREALKGSGYRLFVTTPLEGCNVTFKIEKTDDTEK